MAISSRATLTAGLGLLGAVCLVGPSLGQQPDPGVRKTASSAPAATKPAPAIVGSVDLDLVSKGYDKVKVMLDGLKAEMLQKQSELAKIASEGRNCTEMLAKMQNGTTDYKKMETRLSQLKAQMQVAQEQGQSELTQREADTFAALYKEMQQMVAAVAQQRGLTYVVRVNTEPVSGTEPQSVMAAMSRTVIYADPSTDITDDVIKFLNYYYHKANPNAGTAPAAAPATGTKPAATGSSIPAPTPPPASAAPAKGNK
jgi:Skp family chaperone for outer membrane proteins